MITGSGKKESGYFKNPITETKQYVKGLLVKIVVAFVLYKVTVANLHHLFAPKQQHYAPIVP